MAQFLVALVLGYFPAMAEGQRIGTIIVVGASERKIIFAADSRGKNPITGKTTDNDCKIFTPKNKFMFASAGFEDSFMEDEVTELGTLRFKEPYSFVEKWTNDIFDHFTAMPKPMMDDIVRRLGSKQISVGLFAVVDPKHILRVYSITFNYREVGSRFAIERVIKGEPLRFFPVGYIHTFYEITKKLTPEGIKENADIESQRSRRDFDEFKAIRLVEKTIKWNPKHDTVGGPVDAAELVPNGHIRWIQRKCNCAKE